MANSIPDKTRYTYVYHPSRPHKERWEKAAAKARTSLSKFIIAAVDEQIDEKEELAPRHVRELDGLKNEVKTLREDLQRKNVLLERYEAELKRYRATPWMEADFAGSRRLSEDLVSVLKARGQVDRFQLLEALGIDRRETDLINAVGGQLETLEGFGMVKNEKGVLRWVA
ncbi:MAG: hypothetical protein A4E48_01758 [Methanosaeta sp. PtaU1.Bin060]|jgi:hypothetical protein|nr:MAG: hypothetical protein A4E48_01758 [Methanosaeta sp. PtaU1.Bin060]